MVISPSTNPYPLQRPTDSTSVTKILPVKMFSLIIVSTLLFNIDSKVVHTHTHTHAHTHIPQSCQSGGWGLDIVAIQK